MSNSLKKTLSSVSLVSLMLTGAMAANADSRPTQSIASGQAQQIVQGQDQTQFQNRQRLENRINGGSGNHAGVQQRNRYQHREQKRYGGQSMGQSGHRMQGGSAASSGRRMAGKGGGGGRR